MTKLKEYHEKSPEEQALHWRMFTYRKEIRQAGGAAIMAKHYNEFWNVEEMEENFKCNKAAFGPPGVIGNIVRKSTGDTGSLAFGDVMGQRFYYSWRHSK